MIVLLSAFCVVLSLAVVYFACTSSSQRHTIRSQAARIAWLRRTKNLKTKEHAENWNDLWLVIRDKYEIYKLQDGTWSGQAAKEIFKMLKTEFGKFDNDQTHFITQLVIQLRNVVENHRKYELSLNPLEQDVIFDDEGGYQIVNLGKK